MPYHVERNAANDKEKADRDIRIRWRLAGDYKPLPRKRKPAAEPQP